MPLPSVYDPETTQKKLLKLEKLTEKTQPIWGKMNAAQMLAHLNVAYDLANEKIKSNPSFMIKLLMKLFIKKIIVGEKPYKKNVGTAPEFAIANARDFLKEKELYIANVIDTEKKGAVYFEGRLNPSMGKLTATEWNNLFFKHTTHHFEQFGL